MRETSRRLDKLPDSRVRKIAVLVFRRLTPDVLSIAGFLEAMLEPWELEELADELDNHLGIRGGAA